MNTAIPELTIVQVDLFGAFAGKAFYTCHSFALFFRFDNFTKRGLRFDFAVGRARRTGFVGLESRSRTEIILAAANSERPIPGTPLRARGSGPHRINTAKSLETEVSPAGDLTSADPSKAGAETGKDTGLRSKTTLPALGSAGRCPIAIGESHGLPTGRKVASIKK